jgi:hypothetical protein
MRDVGDPLRIAILTAGDFPDEISFALQGFDSRR